MEENMSVKNWQRIAAIPFNMVLELESNSIQMSAENRQTSNLPV
jgi:hypothetical protein